MSLRTTLCVLALSLLAPLSHGNADEFTLSVLLVNMTPDPVSEEGRACAASLRRTLRTVRHRETVIRGMGETAFREALDNPEGDFMSWTPELFDGLRESSPFETAMLYDCRPNARTLRVMVVSANNGKLDLTLEDVEISRELINWVGDEMIYTGASGM